MNTFIKGHEYVVTWQVSGSIHGKFRGRYAGKDYRDKLIFDCRPFAGDVWISPEWVTQADTVDHDESER